MKLILTCIVLMVASESLAVSAARGFGEDYRRVAESFRRTGKVSPEPAYDQKVQYKDLDVSQVVEWPSLEQVTLDFEWARDLRFVNHKGLLRRSSWMYPDDGCWIRADLAKQNIEEATGGERRPDKVFIFGNLSVDTAFSTSGSVGWWYHVVPVVRVGTELFVIDPAIESRFPLSLEAWVLRQSENLEDVQLALCAADTYGPYDDCSSKQVRKRSFVERAQKTYLNAEERRLKDLGLDGLGYLEDRPPWLQTLLPPFMLPFHTSF